MSKSASGRLASKLTSGPLISTSALGTVPFTLTYGPSISTFGP